MRHFTRSLGHGIFFECIDRTMNTAPASSAASTASTTAKKTVNTAMVATNDEEDSTTDEDMPALVEVPQQEVAPTPVEFTKTRPDELAALAYVNPYDDPGIWAILDEGCNSSTHTRPWRENAEAKWWK